MADSIQVKLPDGSVKEVPKGTTALDIAKSIGQRLADATLVAKTNGDLIDVTKPLEKDTDLRLLTDRDPEALEVYRHSSAHLLAAAVLEVKSDLERRSSQDCNESVAGLPGLCATRAAPRVMVLLLGAPASLILARSFSRSRFQTLWRSIYALPMVTNVVAVGFIWWFVLVDPWGLLNRGLALLGIAGPAWLNG